jgi:hypothetical protein
MGEALEQKNDQIGMMPMSPEMLQNIQRVFAQKISFEVREDAATLTFGSTANIIPPGQTNPEEVMIPQVICFLTIGHLFRLRDMLVKQCDIYEQAMDDQRETAGAGKDA